MEYPKWNKPLVVLMAGMTLAVSAAGCGSNSSNSAAGHGNEHAQHDNSSDSNHHSNNDHSDQHHASNGDLRETTASLNNPPSFLGSLTKYKQEIASTYKLAAEHVELLQWIPCYCGCGESAGHQSNLNCFISEVKDNGEVVWDDHGTRCSVCLEIAQVSAALKAQGQSTLEIREFIDSRYKTTGGTPTLTPMPEA